MTNNIIFSFIILILVIIYQAVVSFVLCFVPRTFRKKKSINGQIILITGAGNGVGRQLAIEFSKHAVCLVLVDINRQWLLQTEKLLDRRSSVFIYDCDISDYKKVYEMAEKVRKEAGDVDILVNNAGIVTGKQLLDLPEDKILKTLEVNALAHFWTCKAFLPAMIERNSGHVVSIVSVAGITGAPRLTDYCASKFAALGFAEALELELREQNIDGIKVTTVCPTLINTGLFQGAKMNNLGSVLTPEYVAKEVVLGVLEEQEMIILPHFVKYIAMFKMFIPRWIAIECHKFTGNIEGMAHFSGRQVKDVPTTEELNKTD